MIMKKTVTLNPGESKLVSFEFKPQEAKTYQVLVNGLSGSIIAVPAVVPPFAFSNLRVQRLTCQSASAWNTLDFWCTISNPTDRTITHILTPVYQVGYKGGLSSPMEAPLYAREITLGPGQSYEYYLAGNQGDRCTTLIGFSAGVPYGGCVFLRDENGNDSPKACV